MHLQGKEAISVITQRSARTLLATALVVAFAKYYNVPVSDMEILGAKLPVKIFTSGSTFVLTLLIINHFVHWFGDYISFQNWNVKDKVNGPAMFDTGSSIISRLENVIQMNENMAKECEGNLGKATGKQLKDFKVGFELFKAELLAIQNSVMTFNSYSAFYVYGWQLIFPVTVAIISIFMTISLVTTSP